MSRGSWWPRMAMVVGLIVSGTACDSGDGQTASGSGSASVAGAGECSPVGTELEEAADETVAVELDEYAFNPAIIEVAAGTVTFEAENIGTEDHELAFLPGGDEVPVTDGAPDEDALAEAGAFELEAFGAGQTCNATYELEPGSYTMFCIVETADGETHLTLGMQGELRVQ